MTADTLPRTVMLMQVRHVQQDDACALASLLNEIIARGGTTAFEEPFTSDALAEALLIGPQVICCFVAQGNDGVLLGFQTVVRSAALPNDGGDIATFTRVDITQRGIGTSLFEATSHEAREKGLVAINATIRADNTGGLSFYTRLDFIDHDIAPALPLDDGTLVDRISKRYLLR